MASHVKTMNETKLYVHYDCKCDPRFYLQICMHSMETCNVWILVSHECYPVSEIYEFPLSLQLSKRLNQSLIVLASILVSFKERDLRR